MLSQFVYFTKNIGERIFNESTISFDDGRLYETINGILISPLYFVQYDSMFCIVKFSILIIHYASNFYRDYE